MHVFNSQSDNYWSSTSYQNPDNQNNAWNVNFNNGNTNNNDKTNEYFVRCVREFLYPDDPTYSYTFRGELKTKLLIPIQKSLFYANGNGLPIGNLTSQFFANCYLDGLDKYITEILGFSNYVRYVDDFIIVDNNKEKLKQAIPVINKWLLGERKIIIHPKKIIIQKVIYGIDFVGYVIRPTYTLVRNSVVKRCRKKSILLKTEKDEKLKNKFREAIISYLGHFSHANSYRLRNKFKHLTVINDKE